MTGNTEFYNLGREALRQGAYLLAVQQLERAVAEHPGNADRHVWLGNAYAWMAATAPLSEKREWGRLCFASYHKALALDPENVEAHFSLMNYYRHVPAFLGGGLKLAKAQAEEVRRRDPARGAYAQALLLEQEGDRAAAIATLLSAAADYPNNYSVNFMLGRLTTEEGMFLIEGEDALRRCLDLSSSENQPGHEKVHALLRQIQARQSSCRRPESQTATVAEHTRWRQ
jgi:tetratricopeptide (TPR) repeat protein